GADSLIKAATAIARRVLANRNVRQNDGGRADLDRHGAAIEGAIAVECDIAQTGRPRTEIIETAPIASSSVVTAPAAGHGQPAAEAIVNTAAPGILSGVVADDRVDHGQSRIVPDAATTARGRVAGHDVVHQSQRAKVPDAATAEPSRLEASGDGQSGYRN